MSVVPDWDAWVNAKYHRIVSGERRANSDHLMLISKALGVLPGDLMPA